ncbi:TPA: hypothetical protein IUD81_002677 [Enterococcus faecalis]|nr:hypothetical protein [Enterococcus faecalis]
MKKQLNYLDRETYFQYFEKIYMDPVLKKRYPLISERIEFLCETIKEKIYTISPTQYFKVHAEILGLDAQLQILVSLIDLVDNKSGISEELIIQCSKEEYSMFIRELCENSSSECLKHALCFSVI